MSGIIYPSPIYGPVHSRRFGLSLGINLLPADGKICTFDCVYCECGYNAAHRPKLPMPTREEVRTALEKRWAPVARGFSDPETVTFAGNGEPTCHPDFPAIVEDTLEVRRKVVSTAKICVLSNATQITRQEVHDALRRVDLCTLKLDAVSDSYIRAVNRPVGKYDIKEILEAMQSFRGHVYIQAMFLKGEVNGVSVDNTGDEYVRPWILQLRRILPRHVTIYTIDRETPEPGLKKATWQELERIQNMVIAAGTPCSAIHPSATMK